jgi:hypothetical protein
MWWYIKGMKKYIIGAAVVALLIAVVAQAKGEVTSVNITKAGNTNVFKFVDGKVTCYVAGGSISCVN